MTNPSNLPKSRINTAFQVASSATRDTDQTFGPFDNPLWRGLLLTLDVSAIGGTTPSITVNVQYLDPETGTTFTVVTESGISATGTHRYLIYPGASDTGSVFDAVEAIALAEQWQVQIDVDTADGDETYTYSIGAQYLV